MRMVKKDSCGRISVKCLDGTWSFESGATEVPRPVFDALCARVEKLRDALKFYAEEKYIEWVTKRSPDEDRYEDVDHGKLAQSALDADLAECEEVEREGV